MDIAAYYDSVASFWDDDYSDAKAARIVAATVSIPRGGACVLDIGCGSGSMFMDLLENGACEIEGLDISRNMVEVARSKYGYDPRIHVTHGDFLRHEQPGYDVLMAFNAYHFFPQPRAFLSKAKQLLRKTDKRSGEIAGEIGYKDPRYFSFVFKKKTGCTPSQYRNGEFEEG